MRLQTGFDTEKGVPIVKAYSFGNIAVNASDEALFSLASTLAALSSFPLRALVRTDTATLSE